jgi:hypothetical protein
MGAIITMRYLLYIIGVIEIIAWITCFVLSKP